MGHSECLTFLRAFLRLHEAAAGTGRSEHWNVDTLIPSARQRESRACPHVPCERRTALQKVPQRSGIGPQRALEANTKIPRAQRESPYSQSFLSERRTDPAEPPIRPAERDRSAASFGGDQPFPGASAPKLFLPRASLRAKDRTPKNTPAERDRSAASIGGEQPFPGASAPKLLLPRASLRVEDRSRGAPSACLHPNTADR